MKNRSMSVQSLLKRVFILFVGFFLLSCGSIHTEEIEKPSNARLLNLEPDDFELIVIDSCQYLLYEDDFNHAGKGFGFMAHKGNCSNPIHCQNELNPILETE